MENRLSGGDWKSNYIHYSRRSTGVSDMLSKFATKCQGTHELLFDGGNAPQASTSDVVKPTHRPESVLGPTSCAVSFSSPKGKGLQPTPKGTLKGALLRRASPPTASPHQQKRGNGNSVQGRRFERGTNHRQHHDGHGIGSIRIDPGRHNLAPMVNQ